MIGLGWTNPIPAKIGGGESVVEIERGTILDGIEKEIGLSPDNTTESYAETAGEAALVAMLWAVSARLRAQAIPETMLEQLPVWEESTGLRPVVSDLDTERRARLAGKMRGQINNALIDIEQVCEKSLGLNYERIVLVDPDDVISYWPAINPGPPGYEWSSNYAHIGVVMNLNGLTNALAADKRDRLYLDLERLLPSWMTFSIGVGDEFVVGQGLVGQYFL